MLGYVTTEKQELKMREYEIYRGYYCGVCKSIGRRYGQIPRLALSYDAAFLALVLAGMEAERDVPTKEHCIIHPVKKNTVVANPFIDYAGDVMLMLTWFNLADDVRDEQKAGSKILLEMMRPLYKKIKKDRGPLCDLVQRHLDELSILEKQRSANLDQVCDTFAKVLEAIFLGGPGNPDSDEKRVLGRLGYHLGKWIYLMDAWDDLADNQKTGAYNPFLQRYGHRPEESLPDFQNRIRGQVEWNLLVCCEELGKTIDLLEINKNKGIIENIVYLGLLRRTEKALGKEDNNDRESL